MGVFRDLPNRQLYLLMLRIALAKTPEDVNKVYGEATSNSYSAKVKIITTSLQQAREMLPDLAVRRPYSRDEATMLLSFDADAYATLGGGFLTVSFYPSALMFVTDRATCSRYRRTGCATRPSSTLLCTRRSPSPTCWTGRSETKK